jgi:hypothetical protein
LNKLTDESASKHEWGGATFSAACEALFEAHLGTQALALQRKKINRRIASRFSVLSSVFCDQCASPEPETKGRRITNQLRI